MKPGNEPDRDSDRETVTINGKSVRVRPGMAAVLRRLEQAGGGADWAGATLRALIALEFHQPGSPRQANTDRTDRAARRPGGSPPRPSRSIV